MERKDDRITPTNEQTTPFHHLFLKVAFCHFQERLERFFLLTKRKANGAFKRRVDLFNRECSLNHFCPRDSRLHSLTPDHVFQQRWRRRHRLAGSPSAAGPTHMHAAVAYLVRCAQSSPRINVLLCHHRGYDLCNATEQVRSMKSSTRSISGRNVLAAAPCCELWRQK